MNKKEFSITKIHEENSMDKATNITWDYSAALSTEAFFHIHDNLIVKLYYRIITDHIENCILDHLWQNL